MKTCLNTATTRGYPLSDDLKYCSKYGYEGIEMDTLKLDEYLETRTLEDLKGEVEGYGLKVAALMAFPFAPFSENTSGLEQVKKYAGIAAFLNAPVLLAFMSGKPPETLSAEKAFDMAVETACRYGDAAGEHNVKVALEPIGRHPFMPGPLQAMKVIEKSGHPGLGIVVDTFHCYRSEVPIEEIKAIPVERLLVFHINDSEDKPISELSDSNRLYPGLGILPLGGYLEVLRDKGYEGFVSVEIFRPEYWQDKHENIARKAKEALDSLLK